MRFEMEARTPLVSPYRAPIWAVDVNTMLRLHCGADERFRIDQMFASVRIGETEVLPTTPVTVDPEPQSNGATIAAPVRVPMSPAALWHLERKRSTPGPQPLTIATNIRFTRVDRVQVTTKRGGAQEIEVAVTSYTSSPVADLKLSSDDWRMIVAAIGDCGTRVVEVRIPAAKHPANFTDAMAHLADAENHYHNSKFSACVVECRKAWESVADQFPGSAKSQRFDALLTDALPGDGNEPRRKLLDALAMSVGGIRNANAHGGPTRYEATRDEAYLVLTSTSAALAMLGEGLTDATVR